MLTDEEITERIELIRYARMVNGPNLDRVLRLYTERLEKAGVKIQILPEGIRWERTNSGTQNARER